MSAWHFHIKGRVQGVGFRPFVKNLADRHGFAGWVTNGIDGVHIELTCSAIEAHRFLNEILRDHPPAGRISNIHWQPCDAPYRRDFKIRESIEEGTTELWITPDIAMCPTCKEEMNDAEDRRHRYAFTTCTQCGPRYSIMKALPYDRPNTTMSDFAMCDHCQSEYEKVDDRRFYSQTNSCPECEVKLFWLKGECHAQGDVNEVVNRLAQGQIVAVKGIGGYLLLTDARSSISIQRLRDRKHRPSKPFATMFPDMASIERWCFVSNEERKALESPEAPIVLLKPRSDIQELVAMDAIAPELNKIGVMLPYAPLLQLIADQFGAPLIATSGNVSGAPICYTEEQAKEHLFDIADAILAHDREILAPQDDSVISFTPRYSRPIQHRRSRGYAPSSVPLETYGQQGDLALGAEMKSAFALVHSGNTYLSQYLGNTSVWESQLAYETALDNLTDLLRFKPKRIIVDKHPNYATSQMGASKANELNIEWLGVQHHEAHFHSVLAEHGLHEISEPVMGFVWDGTGYGQDGQIWGGECFLRNDGEVRRFNHLPYVPVIAGDRMAKSPAISAISFFGKRALDQTHVHDALGKEAEMLLQLRNRSMVKTSSMGRLFDAVASILNVCQDNNFEGRSAMLLQQMAEKGMTHEWNPIEGVAEASTFNYERLAEGLIKSMTQECRERAAFRFHQTLVQWIETLITGTEIKRIVFSGGVFQNALLVDLIIGRLGANYRCYFHEQVPTGDEGIALGQLAAVHFDRLRTLRIKKDESCV